MSIIGPRPLLVRYLPYYTENERHRHDVREEFAYEQLCDLTELPMCGYL